MSSILSQLALVVGYTAMAVAALVVVGAAALATILWFPVRFDFKRDTPSFLDTPYGQFNLNLFVGLSGRRRQRWMFGYILLGRDGEPVRRTRVTSKKPVGA